MVTIDFFLNLLSGGIIGGIASFIASNFFLKHNNNKNRPSIEISDKLIETLRDDGTPALLIKVINKTDKDIADIIFEVEGINNLSPAGSIVQECKKYETIRISIKASCPYYGTSVITSKEYSNSEDILNNTHSFNTGNSLSCSVHL